MVRPTPAAYLEAARKLQRQPSPELRPVNVAFLATFTANQLAPFLIVEGERRGLLLRPWFGPYNQLELQAFDPASDFHASRPEAVVVATRLEDLATDLWPSFLALSASDIESRLQNAAARLDALLAGLRRHSDAPVLLFNFAEPALSPGGLASASLNPSPAGVLARANDLLAGVCSRHTAAWVFDCARLAAETGLDRWHDPRLYALARVPCSAEAQLEIGARLARCLRALFLPPVKCLVLDLDDTLWGGVLGESGWSGIAAGGDYPGSAFLAFQRYLRGLRDRGFLLALASKNDEADVHEVFARRPEMPLGWDDFAAAEIHWRSKDESLRAIAARLNLSTAALAFCDDSPLEREWLRARLPEVFVIDLPEDPAARPAALEASGAFDQLSLSGEDLRRAALYRDEQRRELLRASSQTVEEFLLGLEICAQTGEIDAASLPRVAQLAARTNQFNLTLRRYTEAEIENLIRSGAAGCRLRACDRFGDYGLVGAALAVPETALRWRIDLFLLSCRALGRRLETALLAALARLVRTRGGRLLAGEFVPGRRNSPAAGLYPDHGFTRENENVWTFDLAAGGIPVPGFIREEPL